MTDLKDALAAALVDLAAPLFRFAAHAPKRGTKTAAALDRHGLAIYPRHYYHPFITERDLILSPDEARSLPGVDLDADRQLAFIESLAGRSELAAFPETAEEAARLGAPFHIGSGSFGHGDSDLLYAIVRTHRPRLAIEIGSGDSTRVLKAAIDRTAQETPGYGCRHVCVEPYEQPWLEGFGVEVIRERVERLDPSFFAGMAAGDILFIDSSHIIRPDGDVVFEFLELLPRLPVGAFVHIHDIYTPYHYPREWMLDRGLLWNEQYLLEAFLSLNRDFEVVAALKWLSSVRNDGLAALLPGFAMRPTATPGSFWIRRV
ncbi:MAG: class I SAM-dependent methyltransferase [Alphaproteobacteria bacterium]|nr:class I SAM-dependent methyltransferase [Alphaproteobacteria bacterium]